MLLDFVVISNTPRRRASSNGRLRKVSSRLVLRRPPGIDRGLWDDTAERRSQLRERALRVMEHPTVRRRPHVFGMVRRNMLDILKDRDLPLDRRYRYIERSLETAEWLIGIS